MTLSFGFMAPADSQTLLDLAEKLSQYGFTWIEVAAPESLDPEFLAGIHSVRDRLGYQLAVHARYLGVDPSQPNALIRNAAVQVLLQDLTYAQSIHARRFTMHAGNTAWFDVLPPDHPQFDEIDGVQRKLHRQNLGYLSESLTVLCSALNDQGPGLSVENGYCPWELFAEPDEMAGFFAENTHPRLGATLDFGHAGVAGHSPLEFLKQLKARINHLHLAQNQGGYDLHLPISQLSPGWREALNEVADSPQEMAAIFEWRSKDAESYIRSLRAIRQ